MRFHVMLPVRDEADIIGQCLEHLLTWADRIYVFDTGSVDRTWEIVRDWAVKESRITPLEKRPVYFCDTRVRGWMFHQARRQMRDGDWFVRADADEFYHVPPPEFVRSRMRRHETIAYYQLYDFHLTASEVKEWERGGETLADRARPIEQRRRWFTPRIYTEPRLCRYRETMRWPPETSFPYNAGYLARERIPIRHYPHRDPVQMERRYRLREVMMADQENRSNWSEPDLHHWAEGEWRKFITPDNMAGLTLWRPDEDLPEVRQRGHLRPAPIRALQRLLHASIVRLLDRTRQGFSGDAGLQPIPASVQAELEQALGEPKTTEGAATAGISST